MKPGTILTIILLCSTSLAGCKIILEVPKGGSITTESGRYLCDESQTCEIDVDDADFEETFVATPDDSHEFRGWVKRDSGLCGREDKRYKGCTVSTLAFDGNEDVLNLLRGDIPVYLEPEFVPKPTTTFLFPNKDATARDSVITIRGEATDSDGIMAVTVNGVEASVERIGDSRQPIGSIYPTEVAWEAEIVLDPGSTTLVVRVTDGLENVNAASDSVSVDFLTIPIDFSLDDIGNRLIGLAKTDGFNYNVVAFDLENNTPAVLFEELSTSPQGCYKPDSGEFFHVVVANRVQVSIRSLEIATGAISVAASGIIDPTSEGYQDWLILDDLACQSGSDAVYLTYQFLDESGDFAASRITRFDLVTGEASLLTGASNFKRDFGLYSGAEIYGDHLVVWRYGGFDAPLELIDTESGASTPLPEDEPSNPWSVAVNEARDSFIIVNPDGVYSLPRFDSAIEVVSLDQDHQELDISQPGAVAVDALKNRVLLGEPNLDTIMEIDLATGNRKELFVRGPGEGPRMINPAGLHVMSGGDKAYALDDGGSATEQVIEIDMATGNRRVVGDIGTLNNWPAAGLAVDEDEGLVYAALYNGVLAVDPSTGETTPVAGATSGTGDLIYGISALVLDQPNERLLLSDPTTNAILAMDLQTRRRTILSEEFSRGSGVPLVGIESMAIDPGNNILYAASGVMRHIIAIDLETGDRQIVLDACLDANGDNRLGIFNKLGHIEFNAGDLLIFDSGVMRFEPASGGCQVLGDGSLGYELTDLEPGPGDENIFYATADGGFGLFDLRTLEFVQLSD